MKFPTFTALFGRLKKIFRALALPSLLRHRKKVFRVLIRSVVILVTVIALFYAVVNWWGAGRRKEAFARLSASEMPMTLVDLMADQPAENDNFAMIPLLKSASEQAWILDDQKRHYDGPPGERAPKPGRELLMIQTMNSAPLKEFVKKVRRTPRSDNPDFSLMDEGSGYGHSAESFLTEFDRRNATTLEALRRGMSRSVTATPLLTPGFDKSLPNTYGEFLRSLRESAIPLCLRADAAMTTGNSDKAAESLAIALRFGEVMGSKGYFVSVLLESITLTEVNKRLARGILQHRWTAENLQDLQAGLARMDLSRHIIKSFEANTQHARMWWNWSDHRPQDTNDIAEFWDFDDVPDWVRHNVVRFPSGWFDANGAINVNRALDFAQLVKTAGPLKLWSDAIPRPRHAPSKSTFAQIIHPSTYNGEEIITMRGAYMLVLRQQAIVACELERIRLEKGSYPDTLDAITTLDPMFDTPFLYRKTGDTFRLYSKGPDGVDDHLEHQGRNNLQPSERADWEW